MSIINNNVPGNSSIFEKIVGRLLRPFYKKIKDHELAVVTMKSKKGVICVITNSRHCSFGYDQRVELFGKKGMLISGNKKENSTELFNSNQTNSQKPFLNFFIERYNDA